METKRLILTIVLSLAVLLVWQQVVTKLYPPPPKTAQTQPAATQSATQPTTPFAPSTEPSTVIAQSPAKPSTLKIAQPDTPSKSIMLGSNIRNNDYKMFALLSNKGGAVRSVELTEFAEKVNKQDSSYLLLSAPDYDDIEYLSLATERLVILRGDTSTKIDLGNVNWQTTVDTPKQQATFFTEIVEHGKKLLKISKTYNVAPVSYTHLTLPTN